MADNDLALKLMRKPFEPHQISTMCRPTKKDNPPGKCTKCGGWHKLPAIQLSYVGHAAITDRLLDADPNWAWEPLSTAADGTPFLDKDGGLWIKLTVAGVTRLGYGDAQGKIGGDAMKERIGDALRNAAMRFGAALDLWHKGDLHGVEDEPPQTFKKQEDGSFSKTPPPPPANTETVQKPKPVARKAAKPVPDSGKPWGGEFEQKPEPVSAVPASNAITPENPITDADVIFPGDEKKDRLPTDEEAKGFRERLIKVKDKGYAGLGQWILRVSGKPRTQDIAFTEIARMVDEVEAAEKAGTLKQLLEAK